MGNHSTKWLETEDPGRVKLQGTFKRNQQTRKHARYNAYGQKQNKKSQTTVKGKKQCKP